MLAGDGDLFLDMPGGSDKMHKEATAGGISAAERHLYERFARF